VGTLIQVRSFSGSLRVLSRFHTFRNACNMLRETPYGVHCAYLENGWVSLLYHFEENLALIADHTE
jgi:hypothetical protein